MASLYGYCNGGKCFVTGSTGVVRDATPEEAQVLNGIGGYGYIDTTDNAANPLAPPPGGTPAPVSPMINRATKKNRYGVTYTQGDDLIFRDPSGRVWDEAYDNAPNLPDQPAPPVVEQPSMDPPAGGPTFTPGINFGSGALPGQGQSGQPYHRSWFDVGGDPKNESLNNIYYNSNWDEAWDKVLNQFGGMPGSDFYDFLQGFSQKAQTEYNNLAPYGGADINVADFIDAYAPQIKGVYDLLPGSSKGRRGTGVNLRAQY